MFVTFLFSLFSLFSLTWKEETVYLTYISFRDREAYYREKHDGAYRPVHRTGRSMTGLIDQFTVPIIIGLLKNTDMSLTQLSEEMEKTVNTKKS